MMIRYSIALVLVVLAIGVPSRAHTGFGPRAARAQDPSAPAPSSLAQLPEPVRAAAERGRYWRASRLMHEHLAAVSDTSPALLLATARLHAGWDDWQSVGRLLEGRSWLDRVEEGAGWGLIGRSRIASGRRAEGAEALGRFLELHEGSDRDRAVAELRRGLALAGAGQTAAGLEALARAGRLIPWFSDWSSLLAAEAAAEEGDTAAVRVGLAGAGTLGADRAWRLRLQAAREAGDRMAAREIALETARTSGSDYTRAAAWALLGSLRLAAGDSTRARAAFLEAMEIPAAAGAVDAARALTDLRPTPEEWHRIAEIYARHGNARRAAEGYARYLDAGRGSAAERRAIRLEVGRAHYNAGAYERAERELLELAGEPAVSPEIGAEALYLAARAQYRQGRSEEGQRTLALLPERFPGQPAVTRGLYLLADLKHDDLELGDARRYYRQAAEASPNLNEAGLALMRLGGLAMLEERYDTAAAIFEEYRRLHPEGRRWEQSTYWAARAYRALGRSADAETRLRELRRKEPLSYYGVRAAELLDVPVVEGVPSGPAPDPAAARQAEERLRRVDVLAELDRREDLVHEVERLRAAVAGNEPAEYALAEALNGRGYTLTAIGMGWDLRRRTDAWNARLLRIVYPFPFRSIVLPEARERGVDPYLVAGLIRRESAFNPVVTSSAGAVGLMQVMPETGRELAREVGLGRYAPELLKEAEVNVHLGTLYLATMLDRYDHDLPLVLSAYNAGPTRANRWRNLPEARDPDLFAERIPYSETRNYIRHVLLHRALYRALYPDLGDGSR